MTSTRLCRTSLLALSLAAALAPLGCITNMDSSESDEPSETEEVGSAEQALVLSDLANRVVNLRNEWGCPWSSRCDDHLSWTAAGDAKLYPHDNTQDLVPWRLSPVPGKTDEFYIRSEWNCPAESHCDAHLSWSADGNVKLYPRDNTQDLVPWRFIPVPGTTDQFYIRSRWNCPTDSRCDAHLSWTGAGDVKLFPKDNTADLVPWKVVMGPQPPPPATPIGQFFRNPSGAKPVLSYGRGAGTAPNSCGSQQYDAGLCYPYCSSGYTGVGPMCWSGWLSYGRGAGTTPNQCPSGKELQDGLCYTPCSAGYEGVGPVCWIDNIDQGFCDALFDPALAGAAVSGNVTLSFGIGAGISAYSSVGVETGLVYGQYGEYGCYTSVCTGVVTDVSVNAWGAAGVYVDYNSFSGDAISTFQGASVKFAGFQTAQVIDSHSGQLVGTTDQVSLGAGISPIQIGAQTCTTNVLRRH